MSLQELSKFTITSKYALYKETEKRRETWDEIIDRSLNMHLKKFSALPESDKQEIIEAFDMMRYKNALSSMRCAQFGGPGVEQKNERAYNCCFLHIYNTRCIEKAFYLQLCGVGCGFGLTKQWVDKFPNLCKEKTSTLIYEIEDSIEGWSTSTRILVDSFLEGNEYTGKQIKFSYDRIRPKGSPISHGGTAPGPEGLKLCHRRIARLLGKLSIDRLRPIHVYDILMHTADAVLSGGIRRSATIALFEKTDYEMLTAKTGSWYIDNPQRGRSNNTVLLKRDEVTLDDFKNIIEHTKQFGEPGFAFVDDLNAGFNPCGEIQFLPFYDGKPAVQFCNLSTINGNKVSSIDDLRKYTRAATIIGTLQASYTDFVFLDEIDRKMTEEESLLGVSIMGYMANPDMLLDDDVLTENAKYATAVNEEWAAKLGINPAARVTCTKPDGNSACVVESPFSGIHPAHSPKYFRRVQVTQIDPIYKFFKSINPHMCEPLKTSATGTDDVITFPIKVEAGGAIFKNDLTALEHLKIIKGVNASWVKNGEKNNKKPISHSVSCTVLVEPDDWELVAEYLYDNREYFTTVALLARNGDKDYPQTPYEAVVTEEDEKLWNYLVDNMTPVDYSLLKEDADNTSRQDEVACAGGACSL
jgi:ribonucleoside-diphosphate reductase alpha chain